MEKKKMIDRDPKDAFLVAAIVGVDEDGDVELIDFTPNKSAVDVVAKYCVATLHEELCKCAYRKYQPQRFLKADNQEEAPSPA